MNLPSFGVSFGFPGIPGIPGEILFDCDFLGFHFGFPLGNFPVPGNPSRKP